MLFVTAERIDRTHEENKTQTRILNLVPIVHVDARCHNFGITRNTPLTEVNFSVPQSKSVNNLYLVTLFSSVLTLSYYSITPNQEKRNVVPRG